MKDSFWFQHDSNARTDARILELRAEMGWQGYGLWWALVEKLREATDYQLSNTIIGGLAMDLALPKSEARAFLDICIVVGLLAVEGDCFYAPALRRRMERWDTKRSALSDAGRRGAGKRWAGDKPGHSQAIATPLATLLATPIARREEKRREEKSTSNDVPPPPEALKANAAKQAAALLTDPDDLQHWSEGPLTRPGSFKILTDRLGFLEIDCEHYRKQALVSAEDANVSRTINQWSGWIRNYLNNQLKNGPLLKMRVGGATLPSEPTPASQYPAPGKELAGQVFYINGVPGDRNLDRMSADSKLRYFPTATIVSLAYPEAAYTQENGAIVRR